VFTASTTQPFSSDRSQVGDRVSLTLDKPILSPDGKILVPQGSIVSGSINRIIASGRTGKPASMELDLNKIVTPDGQTFAISAEINTTNGELKAGTSKGRILGITGRTLGGAALGAGAGALLGQTVGNRKPVKGLVVGSMVGGGLGAAAAIMDKGNELIVGPGESLEFRFRQPLSVSSI
jgi:hypothetical protein